jgi:hypothetical protein
LPFTVNGWTLLSAVQLTFTVRENGLFLISSLQLGALFLACSWLLFKSVSPTASYLFCFAKISNQQKATPDRSTALALNSFSWSEGQGAARVKPAIKLIV